MFAIKDNLNTRFFLALSAASVDSYAYLKVLNVFKPVLAEINVFNLGNMRELR